MKGYNALLDYVLNHGSERLYRNGHARSIFDVSLPRIDLTEGFPAINLRPIHYKSAFGELATFIQGGEYIEDFQKNGCNYWNAYDGKYGPDGRPGYLGPIYGKQWRSYGCTKVDQLKNLVKSLQEDRTSRRHLLISANPGEEADMALPPCHLLAQYYVFGHYLDCIVYMRSVDLVLGLPYDTAVYATLQTLLANDCGFIPRYLSFKFGDANIYSNHADNLIKQLDAYDKSFDSKVTKQQEYSCLSLQASYTDIFSFKPDDIKLIGYDPFPCEYKFELSP